MTISVVNVQDALRAEDVEGLLALGAPDDEYSQEARDITVALASLNAQNLTELSVVTVIRQIWNRYFGPFSDEDMEKRTPAFGQVARRLLK